MSITVAPRTIYQVSELTEILRGLLEDSLPRLWVQGEVSNFVRPSSGHWYFTLKDATAQLRCVMFKGNNFLIRPQPKDGDSVLVRGQAGIYAARGDLQFICEHLEPAGVGALLRAYEALKAKLAAEGLFEAKLKRPLPAAPRGIGVITSATGAAIADIINTLSRRFPLGQVYLYPVPVQGAESAPAIVSALRELPARATVDVIILARGGGSLEDLQSFNQEIVARAIRACAVPVISGVGHEIDFTIADFAADLRAPTPTAAAELASPDVGQWYERIAGFESELEQRFIHQHEHLKNRLEHLAARLSLLHPGRRLNDAAQRLDELQERLIHAHSAVLLRINRHLHQMNTRLLSHAPGGLIALSQQHLNHLRMQLRSQLQLRLHQARARLQGLDGMLGSLNPRAVLQRGYAIALTSDGKILTDAAAVTSGDTVQVQLASGTLKTTVNERSTGKS